MRITLKTILIITYLLISISTFAETKTRFIPWQKPEKTGPWYQLKAGYYVIWYEEKDEHIAFELASIGQAIYEDFQDFLGDKVPPTVYIQIQSRTGYANGSYTPVPATINFYTYAMPYDTKDYHWNYRLLAHELLHYMQLEYRGGVSNLFAILFGPVGRGLVGLTPMFGIEGFATAIESDYTSSGRYQNPIFTMPFRADILLDNVDTYYEATRIRGEDFSANYGKSYQYGLQFISYIRAHYGYETAAKIWQNFMEFPLSYSQQYSKDIDMDFYQIYQAMIEEAKEKYSTYNHWKRGKEFKTNTKNAENKRARYSILGASKKGVLIYQAGTDIKEGYMLFDPQSQRITPLFYRRAPYTDVFDSQVAHISKNGNFIAYILPVRNNDYLGNVSFIQQEINLYNDLYIYNVHEKKHTRISRKQQLSTPVISEDGTQVYATQFTNSGNYGRLIKINLSKYKEGFEIIYEESQSMIFYKALSPSAGKIVFVERSPKFGVKLQLLDLNTYQIYTLIQREYGLWITSPQFIDDTHISIVADLVHSTENTAIYEIDISNPHSPIWKRLGQDKVGFHSAVLTEDQYLVYASNNSKGFSIFTYSPSEVRTQHTNIDISAISPPNFYHHNNLQRYQNKESIQTPNIAKKRRPITSIETLPHKKRRVWGIFPSRVEYYYPFFISDFQDNTSISYQIAFKGVTQRSEFIAGAHYYFKNPNIGYNTSYSYASETLGTFKVNSKRTFTYSCTTPKKFTNSDTACGLPYPKKLNNENQIHGLEWSRTLLYKPNNFYLSAQTVSNLVYWAGTDVDTHNNQPIDDELSTRLNATFPIGWDKKLYSNRQLSQDFNWSIAPGISYIPPILHIKENHIRIFNTSQITLPVHRKFAFKLSNFSLWNSQQNKYIKVNQFPTSTLRLNRVTKPILYSNFMDTFSTSFNSTSMLSTPLQSTFAIDILLSLTNISAGNYLFEPYVFYTNLFAEQTLGISDNNQWLQVSPQIITGIENGLRIGIIAITLDISAGLVLQIPYTHSTLSPLAFISVGTVPLSHIAGVQ